MQDQANQLRSLVNQTSLPPMARPAPGPSLVVLSGGKGGVGTTTLALNLAVELSRLAKRILLVDADPDGGDIATLCGIQERHTIADVLAERRTVQEAVQPGPEGIQVLPGAWGLDWMTQCSAAGQERLVAQLRSPRSQPQIVVLDAGSGTSRLARRFWQAADEILLVTTAELTAVMDAYAITKVLAAGDERLRINLLINFAPDDSAAADVHLRLARACLRFLGIRLRSAGHVQRRARLTQQRMHGLPELRWLAAKLAKQSAQNEKSTQSAEAGCR